LVGTEFWLDRAGDAMLWKVQAMQIELMTAQDPSPLTIAFA